MRAQAPFAVAQAVARERGPENVCPDPLPRTDLRTRDPQGRHETQTTAMVRVRAKRISSGVLIRSLCDGEFLG